MIFGNQLNHLIHSFGRKCTKCNKQLSWRQLTAAHAGIALGRATTGEGSDDAMREIITLAEIPQLDEVSSYGWASCLQKQEQKQKQKQKQPAQSTVVRQPQELRRKAKASTPLGSLSVGRRA